MDAVAKLIELISQLKTCDSISCDGNLQVAIHQIESQLPCEIEGGCRYDSSLIQQQQQEQQSCANVDSRHCIICNILELQNKARLVKCHMGCMAQCRGARGDELRDAGAISAVFSILWRMTIPLHNLNMSVPRYDKIAQVNDVARFDMASPLPSTFQRTRFAEVGSTLHAQITWNYVKSCLIVVS
jgi:hypothetical protein